MVDTLKLPELAHRHVKEPLVAWAQLDYPHPAMVSYVNAGNQSPPMTQSD